VCLSSVCMCLCTFVLASGIFNLVQITELFGGPGSRRGSGKSTPTLILCPLCLLTKHTQQLRPGFKYYLKSLSICSSLLGVPDGRSLQFWEYFIGPLSQASSIKHRYKVFQMI
jgi:hypothetical protein